MGLNERYDESLLLFNSQYYNNELNIFYEKKNQIETRNNQPLRYEDLSNLQKAKLQENNVIDIKLYEYVVDHLYPMQLQKYMGNLQEDLKTFINDSTDTNWEHKYKYWPK